MIALAFDLGGSSGKAVAGRFDGQRLHVYEIHRFRNDPVRAAGRLHWDILRLLHEVEQGIAAAGNAGLGEIESLAIDGWGCDFGLLDRHGELIGNPHHYRDELARGAMEEVLTAFGRVAPARLRAAHTKASRRCPCLSRTSANSEQNCE